MTGGSPGAPILQVGAVTKTFERTRALRGVDLAVDAGEVHGLLGANGAGKSTLSRIVCGHIPADAGEIRWRGAPVVHRRARDALAAGITIVTQETSLATHLSVLENIFLPELGRPGRLSYRRMRQRADEVLQRLGVADSVPLGREVGALSAAQRQLVEIAKALALNADLIFFDEPTTSLSPLEVERLFDVMAKLRADGRALVFVSHRLEEVFAITDRVTVLREGQTVAGGVATAALTQPELIRLMVGADLGAVYAARPGAASARTPVLEVQNLRSVPLVHDVSFQVGRGEILGLGGLLGAGRSETLETIFGLRPPAGGQVRLAGRPFMPRRPADAIRAGLGFVAEERRVQGIVPDFTVRENLLLGHLGAGAGSCLGLGLGYGRLDAEVAALLRRLDLPDDERLDASILDFSGGMQQKILIGRWLLLRPKVLLLDEPTKGVDIATRASIYKILRELAADGVGIVVVSSDFDELLGLCSRIVVLSDGATVADIPTEILDEEKLTLLAAPRTSMRRTSRMLRALVEEVGGAGFWALIDASRVCCLDATVADPAADPGLRAGGMPLIDESGVGAAVRAAGAVDAFVHEADRSRQTLVVPIRSARGHEMGAIGITLAGDRSAPPAAPIRSRIQQFFASQT